MALLTVIVLALSMAVAPVTTPFWIRVIDRDTGRGVPLVQLSTALNGIRFWTDSNGIAAIDDGALVDRDVIFSIKSHGYEFQERIFDEPAMRVHVQLGHHVDLKVRRVNIAERLYRITGAGIYRDSVLAGVPVPIAQPLLNGGVTGQDTNVSVRYQDRLFWCYGDTFGFAAAIFSVSCATSQLPGKGGLEPETGINLTYFVDAHGFSRNMLPLPLRRSHASSHPFQVTEQGVSYWYLYPHQRVRNDWKALTDPKSWESYTCLEPGVTFDAKNPRLERRPDGTLAWDWKPDTDRIDAEEERQLIARGLMKNADAFFALRDGESGKETLASPSSVAWNAYRKKWILLAERIGSVYYSEADQPIGPWNRAVKIVGHDNYNFYNVVQHPFFDQDDGRLIYLEGTYTASFSGAKELTPRYDYNQIIYRLHLDDPRLFDAKPG